MKTDVYLTSFHDIKRVHTFRCPLCAKVLGEGRIGILVLECSELSGLVGKQVTCCDRQISVPEVFPDLSQADTAVARYLRALKQFEKDLKDNPTAAPPFIVVPATQMGLTPERLRNSLPSSSTAQGN